MQRWKVFVQECGYLVTENISQWAFMNWKPFENHNSNENSEEEPYHLFNLWERQCLNWINTPTSCLNLFCDTKKYSALLSFVIDNSKSKQSHLEHKKIHNEWVTLLIKQLGEKIYSFFKQLRIKATTTCRQSKV